MLPFLKNHPFAVEAFFESSLVLTFALPKERLQAMIPDSLELDCYADKWAFVAVAMVQTKDLRPKGFPKIFGNDFFLIGYRVFVKYTTSSGKRLRGLYILKSETDKRKMKLMGNIFTHYNYTTTDIERTGSPQIIEIKSRKSGFSIKVEKTGSAVLPSSSPFSEWKEARRFAGPLPFTFTYDKEKREMLIIEGVRQNWQPIPITVLQHHFPFVNSLNIETPVLASAFIVENIPYHWKKGRKEIWKKKESHSRA